MNSFRISLVSIGVLWMGGAILAAAAVENPETPEQQKQRIAWWREARFGMFIHWGPVSLKGTEISWSRANSNPKCPNKGGIPVEVYDNLYKQFNPVKFNADEWASLAKETGMKYVVLTAKHCDGFLLWHSKVSDYNMAATPFKRDICAELSTALRKQDLRVGWYFSPMDWKDPDFRTERNADFVARMQGEIKELLTNYGTIDLLWFDTDAHEAMYDQANTYRMVKQLQPRIVIDNRLDMGSGGDYQGQKIYPNTDYYTPEQRIGGYDDQRPWETCMTVGRQWAWKPNDQVKTTAQVLDILARCVGGDGNLLLNVGPMPDGSIEQRQVDVLKGVGAWMKKNSESIYGTRGGPYKPGLFGACTRKGDAIYLHITKWPGESVTLPALSKKVVSASVLSGGEAKFEQADKGLTITVAPENRVEGDTVVKLQLAGPAMEIAPIDTPQAPKPAPAKPAPKKK